MKVSVTFYVLNKWKMFCYREFLVDTKSTLKVHKTLTWFSGRALNLVHILLRFISGKIFPASKTTLDLIRCCSLSRRLTHSSLGSHNPYWSKNWVSIYTNHLGKNPMNFVLIFLRDRHNIFEILQGGWKFNRKFFFFLSKLGL